MSEYNFEHSRRVSKSAKSLHDDLESMPTKINDSDSDSPSLDLNYGNATKGANRPRTVRISNIPYEQIVYKVLPSSTMSPKATKITVHEDDGNTKVLDLQRIQTQKQQYHPHHTIQNFVANVDNINRNESMINNVPQTERQSLENMIPKVSPNRASLFGNFEDGKRAGNLTEFPLLERIPIIGKQAYNATIKELRNRINGLQTLSLKLHSGAEEKLFDILQKKVVKLSQSGRAHQHQLDGMRLEIEYLLNEIISQQNMRQELYTKIDTMDESKKELLIQIRESNSKLHQQNNIISEWRAKYDEKQENLKEKDRKIERLNKRLTYQEAEIDHGKKITEQNLNRLQTLIKKINNDLKTEKELNDSLRFKLNGANLKIHKFKDDVKDLQGKVTFYEQFKEKSEKQQERIAEFQIEVSNKKEKLERTKELLQDEQNKNAVLNGDILELKQTINRMENTELSLQDNITSLTKELETRSAELKQEKAFNEAEIKRKNSIKAELDNERKLKNDLEEDYEELTKNYKAKLIMMEDEMKTKEMGLRELRHQYKEQGLLYEEKMDDQERQNRDSIKSIKTEYITQCSEYENRVLMINKENENLQNAIKRIQTDYQKLSNIWENDQQTIKNMTIQMESAREKIDKLIGESHKKSIKIEELRLDIKNSKNECEQLNKIMMNKDKLIESQSKELQDLRKRVNELLDLLDAKDQSITSYTKQIKKLNVVQDKYKKLCKDYEELQINKSRITTALQSEKAITKKLDEKLKSSSKSFSEMISKDQEELNKLNKLLKTTQKECNKKSKKAERLSVTLEDIKRNFHEERELLQDAMERLKKDYGNLQATNDSSKELWEKRVKNLSEKLEKYEDTIDLREKEIMRMSIDMAKIKSQIAVTAQQTHYEQQTHYKQQKNYDGINKNINGKNGGSKNYLVDQLNQQKQEIDNLYSLLNETHHKKDSFAKDAY